MAPPQTTWEDFVQLGETKRDIYVKLNSNRGSTMVDGESDMHLNEGICITYGWYCYNVIKGQVSKFSTTPYSKVTTTVIRTWDNTGDDNSMSVYETITRDEVQTVTLTTVDSAKITLNRSDIIVDDVAGSGKSLTVGSETNKDATPVETTETINYTVSITVKAGEKVELIETKTESGEDDVYHVPYGASSTDDLIGTQGDKYNDHYYWAYSFNSNFGNPTPNIGLKGTLRKTAYTFSLKYTEKDGAKAKYLNLKGDVLEFISNDGTPKRDYHNGRPGI